jgi:hypothetical protein
MLSHVLFILKSLKFYHSEKLHSKMTSFFFSMEVSNVSTI